MPQRVYPGQFKFHINEEAKQAKQRAAARLRMAKLRQNRSSKENIIKSQNNKESINEAQQIKQRVGTRLRMVKLRQNQSKDQINKTNLLQTQWRQKQREKQKNFDQASEQLMAQKANERYYTSSILYIYTDK
jgi:hypothetical protein